jgi:hypothetical protein
MKGKIKINYEFDEKSPEKFTTSLKIHGVTPAHLIHAVVLLLIETIEKEGGINVKETLTEIFSGKFIQERQSIISQGDA